MMCGLFNRFETWLGGFFFFFLVVIKIDVLFGQIGL